MQNAERKKRKENGDVFLFAFSFFIYLIFKREKRRLLHCCLLTILHSPFIKGKRDVLPIHQYH